MQNKKKHTSGNYDDFWKDTDEKYDQDELAYHEDDEPPHKLSTDASILKDSNLKTSQEHDDHGAFGISE